MNQLRVNRVHGTVIIRAAVVGGAIQIATALHEWTGVGGDRVAAGGCEL
ncbi:MAG: hypothetical protein WAL56_19955 [Candidatus Sulfotelmatobacter sp.]